MIIILKGGISAEREVSFWTAATAVNSLQKLNMPFVEVDAADADWLTQITQYPNPVVLIALHGPFGEDGQVQQALEEKGIPYTGSNAAVSALAIDKAATKKCLEGLGIHLPKSVLLTTGDEIAWQGAYPAIVKPNSDGSSFGISIVRTAEELATACIDAFSYGTSILIEDYIQGVEVTCGILDIYGKIQVLPLVEIRPKEEFFNFDAKYTASKCDEICPAEIPSELSELIQQKSAQIFQEIGARQYARVDWIIRDGIPYFLEINTLPGMTGTSLINKELAAADISFEDFVSTLIETAQ